MEFLLIGQRMIAFTLRMWPKETPAQVMKAYPADAAIFVCPAFLCRIAKSRWGRGACPNTPANRGTFLMTSLFDPISFGAIDAPNRIMMAPLTRGRATRSHVPTPLMGEYYSQRASAGVIISEATGISQQGLGWPGAPGLWSEEQVAAWRPIVRAVHEAGGRMIAQLWHMGRIVHPDYLGGAQPVSASATHAPGKAYTYEGPKPYVESRALEIDEIKEIIRDYKLAAEHAMAAGFDGVQLHAANGYLLDQFLRDGTNRRTDRYGGAVENRIRLMVEATQMLISGAGADRR